MGLGALGVRSLWRLLGQLFASESFDFVGGSSNYLDLGDATVLKSLDSSDPFTIGFWFKFSSSSTMFMYSDTQGSAPYTGREISWLAGALDVFICSDFGTSDYLRKRTTEVYNDDLWHHAFVEYDGSETFNGISIRVDMFTTTPTSTNGPLVGSTVTSTDPLIGRRGGGTALHYTGLLHGWTVWDKALTTEEKWVAYNNNEPPDLTIAGPTANVVNYYPHAEHPTTVDEGSGGNDAALTNMSPANVVADVPKRLNTVKGLDDTHSPIVLYTLDGDLVDTSGNSRPALVIGDGTETYSAMPLNGTRELFNCAVANNLRHTTHVSALAVLGDITIECTVRLNRYPTSGEQVLVRFGGAVNEAEAENVLWQVRTLTGGALGYFSEHGGGINAEYTTGPAVVPIGNPSHIVMTRESGVIKFYVNNQLVGTSSALTDPTGGGSSLLSIGGVPFVGATFDGRIGAVKVIAGALTLAQINAETSKALTLAE